MSGDTCHWLVPGVTQRICGWQLVVCAIDIPPRRSSITHPPRPHGVAAGQRQSPKASPASAGPEGKRLDGA
jgi:hypothetical protein